MEDVTTDTITLLKKQFNINKLWMFEQFFQVFEKNILMQGFELELVFLNFLVKEGMKEVLFFPEPIFDTENVGAKLLTIVETPEFIRKNAPIWTNNHLANQDLTWIFTISHMGDYLLSGPTEFVKKALVYLKNAGATKKAE
ncbi:MAG: hypothetical protein ACXAEU_15990 [Candidatus Hodarchaeales archaeon]